MSAVCQRCGRPKLLDLYCCAGGAGMGYHRAGFCVTGVDIRYQGNYPFRFVCGDALTYVRKYGHEYAAFHGSPPCQDSSTLTKGNRGRDGWLFDLHVDLIAETREAFAEYPDTLTVIENVMSAPIRRDLRLCGEMFGLSVIRHRKFELGGWWAEQPKHIKHRGLVQGWNHGKKQEGPYFGVHGDGGGKGTVTEWQQAMGINWTDEREELVEAVPPAYTEFIGSVMLDILAEEGKAA